jgi:hypothetical protein
MASPLFRLLITGVAAVLLAGLAVTATASGKMEGQGVKGTAKADSLSACVKSTDWMRRNHMELITHSRDETVRKGIRIKDNSLANCVDCHSRTDQHRNPVPVNAGGEFCDGCHSYTAVNITCFQCHATVPDTATAKR